MVSFFIQRPIFAASIAIIMLLAGAICYFILPVSQFPDITPPQVVVSAVYPGASAQVVADTSDYAARAADKWCSRDDLYVVLQFQRRFFNNHSDL